MFIEDVLYFLRNWRVYLISIKTKLGLANSSQFDKEYNVILKFGPTPYCWEFRKEYRKNEIIIGYDNEKNLNYFDLEGKRMFLPVEYSKRKLKKLVWSLLIEQDIRSPHRYVKSYDELSNKILFDVGAAEGIFSLMAIEYVSKVFLFEYNEIWIRALQETFKPWKEKVVLIPQKVGVSNDNDAVTLSTFLLSKKVDSIFLKMDIEGAEIEVLHEIKSVLSSQSNIELAVCTYHRPDDFATIKSILESINYSINPTEGTIYFNGSFNKVLIKSKKN
ncbi:MAG: FkbM family methyltransferase [Saprospiraceae bacterium]|nr:FkbM family methyltransferase [Saprospiraceae bacterium]